MAHCPPELLDDLADLFAEVRGWGGITEKKRGVFYLHRAPFLHFHLLEGPRRCGDIKGRDGWARFELPRPISVARRRMFLREIKARYRPK